MQKLLSIARVAGIHIRYSTSISDKWDVGVAVALFRPPTIAQQMSDSEHKFSDLCERVEQEHSFKNDFELRLDKDILLLEKRKKLEDEGRDLSELDVQIGVSALFVRDEWTRKGKEAINTHLLQDGRLESKDVKSVKRKLDRKLLLLTRQNVGVVLPWQLPFLINDGIESLRETAERCMKSLFSSPMPNARILGNSPSAHYRYKYPKQVRERRKTEGMILFIYPCQLMEKQTFLRKKEIKLVFNKNCIEDYKWCTSEELRAATSRRYTNALKSITFE